MEFLIGFEQLPSSSFGTLILINDCTLDGTRWSAGGYTKHIEPITLIKKRLSLTRTKVNSRNLIRSCRNFIQLPWSFSLMQFRRGQQVTIRPL